MLKRMIAAEVAMTAAEKEGLYDPAAPIDWRRLEEEAKGSERLDRAVELEGWDSCWAAGAELDLARRIHTALEYDPGGDNPDWD